MSQFPLMRDYRHVPGHPGYAAGLFRLSVGPGRLFRLPMNRSALMRSQMAFCCFSSDFTELLKAGSETVLSVYAQFSRARFLLSVPPAG